tara:strand:+ start:58 stop:228 length:171 start_codon:yes stop_codon:yes gene_type:complete
MSVADKEKINMTNAIFPFFPDRNARKNINRVMKNIQLFSFVINGIRLSNMELELYL